MGTCFFKFTGIIWFDLDINIDDKFVFFWLMIDSGMLT